MKIILYITLSFIPFFGLSQVKIDSTALKVFYPKTLQNKSSHTVYSLDSTKMPSMPYMDPADIMSIEVKKPTDSINKMGNSIYIKLKKHPYHFITIDDLTKKCVPNFDRQTQAVIYVIDEKFVPYSADIIFETTFIKYIEVLSSSQIKYFNGSLSDVIMLMISTKFAPVYLHGTSSEFSIKQYKSN